MLIWIVSLIAVLRGWGHRVKCSGRCIWSLVFVLVKCTLLLLTVWKRHRGRFPLPFCPWRGWDRDLSIH